jgi:23S rRNA pseudouridine1911/1915/1917 synthase
VESKKIVATYSDRLDKLLSKELNISRNQIEKLIKSSLVKINQKIVTKPSYKVSKEDTIEYEFLEAEKKEPLEINFDVQKLYEDEDVLVINKPANLVVHPAPSVKEATLVDWLKKEGISLSTISGEERHGIVHRLDKDTSGAMIIAKNNKAHQKLSEQLLDRSMGRYYIAVINIPLKENIIVNKAIGRNPKNRLKMAVIENAKEAKTSFAKIAQAKNNTELIAAKLFSGRTHQIRVHLSSLNRYILGDKLYAPSSDKYQNRMLLHARVLYFIHPRTEEFIEIEAPLFSDMEYYLKKNFEGNINEKITKDSIKALFT